MLNNFINNLKSLEPKQRFLVFGVITLLLIFLLASFISVVTREQQTVYEAGNTGGYGKPTDGYVFIDSLGNVFSDKNVPLDAYLSDRQNQIVREEIQKAVASDEGTLSFPNYTGYVVQNSLVIDYSARGGSVKFTVHINETGKEYEVTALNEEPNSLRVTNKNDTSKVLNQ